MTENTTNRLFSKDHEWILPLGDNKVRLGITDFAAHQLGDIVYVELPSVDSKILASEEIGTVESVKSASEIYTPVSGIVVKVNDVLEDSPELVNDEPFEGGWIAEIELLDSSELEALMTIEEYREFATEEED